MNIAIEDAKRREFDLCVIGSGPAGIISALEFASQCPNEDVVLVEFGSSLVPLRKSNSLDQSIRVVNKENHHESDECTDKCLGGTSATWGGRCVMYDEVDFIPRPLIKDNCTWDLSFYESTKPYVGRACEYFECGRPAFDSADAGDAMPESIADGFIVGNVTDRALERWSLPTHFGVRYEQNLKDAKNLFLLLGVKAQRLGVRHTDGSVDSVILSSDVSDDFELKAKRFIIATGTQEATRLLLKSPHVFDLGGEVPCSLGKFYQGHINGQIASVKFTGDPAQTDFGFNKDVDGTYIRRRFQFSAKFLVENNLLNTAIWLDNFPYYKAEHRSGPLSFVYLMMITPWLNRFLAPPAIIHSFTKGKRDDLWSHVKNVIRGLPGSVITPLIVFRKRYLSKRKMPGLPIWNKRNHYALRFHAEQMPDESNCMKLSKDGDQLEIHYSVSDEDVESVIRCHEALDTYLRETNCGYLDFWHKPGELATAIRLNTIDGVHQSGTTRIGRTIDSGVVDPDLKVFGTSNLYVCSSSVFPTSGQANPTFFTGVCAVRLINHIVKNASR